MYKFYYFILLTLAVECHGYYWGYYPYQYSNNNNYQYSYGPAGPGNPNDFLNRVVRSGITSIWQLIQNGNRNSVIPTNQKTTTTKTTTQTITKSSTMLPNTSNQEQCGVAPQFKPCLTIQDASARLLDCCIAKNLPTGCYDLCRYDVTQTEIKQAADAGLCGLFDVAPYLECASDGNNNVGCCRQRGLASKSGSQCEVLCSSPIANLGLQHLVCQNVISDLIRCHYTGLKP